MFNTMFAPSLCVSVLWVLLPSLIAAQERLKYVYHVYVDPIHGDDHAAYHMNPKNLATPPIANWKAEWPTASSPRLELNKSILPLALHPIGSVTPQIGGRVIHAPYPFKTIDARWANNRGGALEYVNSQILGNTAGNRAGVRLPKTFGNYQITHVIIHCLPGLYGPVQPSATDSDSGIPFNGETFPIRMIHGVSLQGTSALDTILDARGRWSTDTGVGRHSIISFAAVLTISDLFKETFVDGFTIRNNTNRTLAAQGNTGFWGDGTGAGIYIGGQDATFPVISNNFIVNNIVGIAIESDTSTNPVRRVHQPVIVHNTITTVPGNDLAPLTYGIWSGDRRPILASGNTRENLNYGRAAPLLFNNTISAPRNNPVSPVLPLRGAVAMAGLHWDDATVRSYGIMQSGLPPLNVSVTNNYNAFQERSVWNVMLTQALVSAYTVPSTPTLLWPVPAIQATEAPPGGVLAISNTNLSPMTSVLIRVGNLPTVATRFDPRVDITAWTHPNGTGTLFIRDTFRNHIDAGAGAGMVRCQHDYRLAPSVRTSPTAAATTNPLIGQGINVNWDAVPNASGNVILLFSFGQTAYTWGERIVDKPPGIPVNADNQDVATFTPHCWDFDADGWGNPRFDVNITPVGGLRPEGDVDLGADEVGEVVISGYLNSTRIFSQPPALPSGGDTPLTRDCINPYYFYTAGARIPIRPEFTSYLGEVGRWYQHIEAFAMTATDKYWTHGFLMPVSRWTHFAGGDRVVSTAAEMNPGAPRSMYCDFGTLLLPDPKAWGKNQHLAIQDKYGMLPWYNNLDDNPLGLLYRDWDNQHAYWYPVAQNSTKPAKNKWLIEFSQPYAAMVAAPGTMENSVAVTQEGLKSFLDNVAFPAPLVAWPQFVTGQADINFDGWGVGDIGNTSTPQNVLNLVGYHPSFQWHGIRINCQTDFLGQGFPGGRYSNLQTFLVVNGVPTVETGSGQTQGGTIMPTSSAIPMAENLERSNRAVQAAMRSQVTKDALRDCRARVKAMRDATDQLLRRRRGK
jgi:hypothetical protein